jgi:hypothetical protein
MRRHKKPGVVKDGRCFGTDVQNPEPLRAPLEDPPPHLPKTGRDHERCKAYVKAPVGFDADETGSKRSKQRLESAAECLRSQCPSGLPIRFASPRVGTKLMMPVPESPFACIQCSATSPPWSNRSTASTRESPCKALHLSSASDTAHPVGARRVSVRKRGAVSAFFEPSPYRCHWLIYRSVFGLKPAATHRTVAPSASAATSTALGTPSAHSR